MIHPEDAPSLLTAFTNPSPPVPPIKCRDAPDPEPNLVTSLGEAKC